MNTKSNREKRIEVLLWSIAFPGFGQLLNKKYVKAVIFIILEIIINVKGNINAIIMKSFLFDMQSAIEQTNYSWFMFYPCVYLFAIWDAYHDTGGGEYPFKYLPFVVSAYFGTLGVIYSTRFTIKAMLIGPIFLPIIAMILGFIIGEGIRKVIIYQSSLQSREVKEENDSAH